MPNIGFDFQNQNIRIGFDLILYILKSGAAA